MSFVITHRKNSAWTNMVIRQQATDVIAYGHINTTQAKAKELKKHVDHLITLGKKNTLESRRAILSFVLDNKKLSKKAICDKLCGELAKKYANRKGGYTRVVKLDPRAGDNTKMAIIALVD